MPGPLRLTHSKFFVVLPDRSKHFWGHIFNRSRSDCPLKGNRVPSSLRQRIYRVLFIIRYGSYCMTVRQYTNRHFTLAWWSMKASNIIVGSIKNFSDA